MDRICSTCKSWDNPHAGLHGWCQTLADALRDDHGVTYAGPLDRYHCGTCDLWEASEETLAEEAAERAHQDDLRAEAGDSYPASLGRGPAVCRGAGA